MIVDVHTSRWIQTFPYRSIYECRFFVVDPCKKHETEGIYRYYWVKRT